MYRLSVVMTGFLYENVPSLIALMEKDCSLNDIQIETDLSVHPAYTMYTLVTVFACYVTPGWDLGTSCCWDPNGWGVRERIRGRAAIKYLPNCIWEVRGC